MLIEHSNDFIAMADLDGNLTYMNTAGQRMIGLAEGEDPRRLRITDYVAPESMELVHNTILPAVLTGSGYWEGEMRWRNLTTGEIIDVSRSIFLVRDGSGQPMGLASVTHDITRRKRTEAALRDSQEHLAAMIRQTTAGIAEADLEGRLILVNDTYCKMLGRSREELLGLQVQDITYPEDRPNTVAQFKRCVKEPEFGISDQALTKALVWIRLRVGLSSERQ
jgi:PAS domain S-box-containing protein